MRGDVRPSRHDAFRIAVALSILLAAPDGAIAEQLAIKTYNTEAGLAHNRVKRIVQDSHGFLWFCTADGLSRFDGYQFTNYRFEDGLPAPSINDLLETSDGVYWIATNSIGVVQFDLAGVSTAGLTRATLVLTIASNSSNWGSTGRTIDAHRLAEDWTEGNGNSAAGTSGSGPGVTWNCATDSLIEFPGKNCAVSWNGGGGFAPATGPGVLITNTTTGEVSFDVTADVLSGAQFGWLIKKTLEGKSGRVEIYSKEAAAAAGNAALGPRLILEY